MSGCERENAFCDGNPELDRFIRPYLGLRGNDSWQVEMVCMGRRSGFGFCQSTPISAGSAGENYIQSGLESDASLNPVILRRVPIASFR